MLIKSSWRDYVVSENHVTDGEAQQSHQSIAKEITQGTGYVKKRLR